MVWLAILSLGFALGVALALQRSFPVPQLLELKLVFEKAFGSGENALRVNEEAVVLARNDDALSGKADVVMVGDSITLGGRWNEFLPDTVVHNRGVGTDTVAGVRARTDQVLKKDPQAVFIMIGINDVMLRNENAAILAAYRETLQALEPVEHVFVQSVLLCAGPRCSERVRAQIQLLNAGLKMLAVDEGAVFLDLNGHFAPLGTLRDDLTYDGVHLNGRGYALWTKLISPYVRGATG